MRGFKKRPSTTIEEIQATVTTPHPFVNEKQWEDSKSNVVGIASTYLSFFILGMNDSSYGVLLQELESFYNVSYLDVSLLFLSPVAGFIISTLLNHSMHAAFGRRGIAMIAGFSQIIAYTIACLHPPFYALILGYMFIGLGAGAKNASWNSFISGLDHANEFLGLLHGSYGLGATIMPLIASFLLKSGWKWYMIYYILIGLVVVDLFFSTWAFRKHNSEMYLIMSELQPSPTPAEPMSPPTAGDSPPLPSTLPITPRMSGGKLTWECCKQRAVILTSLYLLSYVGSEVSLGGWLVTFMIKVRHGTEFNSRIVSSGFWGGITVGRVVLGFVTSRLFNSVTTAAASYLISAIALHLMLWLIPNFVSSAVCASFLGFFLGALFPCSIMQVSNLVPKSMRTVAIGICAAVGASGAAIVPFMVGAIADAKGVQALQPIILACLVLCLCIWLVLGHYAKKTRN